MTNTDDFRVKTTAGRLVTADAPVICVNPMICGPGLRSCLGVFLRVLGVRRGWREAFSRQRSAVGLSPQWTPRGAEEESASQILFVHFERLRGQSRIHRSSFRIRLSNVEGLVEGILSSGRPPCYPVNGTSGDTLPTPGQCSPAAPCSLKTEESDQHSALELSAEYEIRHAPSG